MESKIISRYDEIKNVKALSRELNTTEDSVSRILAKNGILDWLTLKEEEKVNIEKKINFLPS